MNLALVALDTPELEQTVAHIKSTCSVEVNFLGIDLTAQGAPEAIG
jgi:hypothetical protein